ncbi:MAG: hypothetical protein V7785_00690 [Bermanella sp.]
MIIEANFNSNDMNNSEFKEYSRRSNTNGEAHDGVVLSRHQVSENL